ncbi:hypothetical protein BDV37DRAFT_267321 [Aspergillus pseudonomiae]|uniref:Uncharacterized protein n=1 Tax=Aspergillus pseudonomiae TaxID=1506151 RepID=A0A5N7CRQ1_9EURO|nr:uncharacterized protein BDV37DRAFT_267321 [Aspergillus pseudonomiae]KAE8396805.1 hypothetical protein BDV37DRAFT_267321 [Aspergillus pseudonomiae]
MHSLLTTMSSVFGCLGWSRKFPSQDPLASLLNDRTVQVDAYIRHQISQDVNAEYTIVREVSVQYLNSGGEPVQLSWDVKFKLPEEKLLGSKRGGQLLENYKISKHCAE